MIAQHLNAITEHMGKAGEAATMGRAEKARAELNAATSYVASARRLNAKREELLDAYRKAWKEAGLKPLEEELKVERSAS